MANWNACLNSCPASKHSWTELKDHFEKHCSVFFCILMQLPSVIITFKVTPMWEGLRRTIWCHTWRCVRWELSFNFFIFFGKCGISFFTNPGFFLYCTAFSMCLSKFSKSMEMVPDPISQPCIYTKHEPTSRIWAFTNKDTVHVHILTLNPLWISFKVLIGETKWKSLSTKTRAKTARCKFNAEERTQPGAYHLELIAETWPRHHSGLRTYLTLVRLHGYPKARSRVRVRKQVVPQWFVESVMNVASC